MRPFVEKNAFKVITGLQNFDINSVEKIATAGTNYF
jgi:hypothetical protein